MKPSFKIKATPFFRRLHGLLRAFQLELYIHLLRHLKINQRIVPLDFDWEYYLDSNFDLRKAGLQSEVDAIRHYAHHGFFEERIYRLPDKTLLAKHEDTRLRQVNSIAHFNKQQYQIIKNNNYSRPITVSVVITLYNYAGYIETCIQSVLNSSLKDIEIVIVNDFSTDDSLARCQAFLPATIPITIIDKQVNTGLTHCRNLGIQLAKGAYVFILDADNEIYPSCLEEHLSILHSNASLIACYAQIDMFDESGAFFGQNSKAPFDFEKLHRGNYIDAMAMFNRQKLLAIGAYDEHLLEHGIGYEDYELWLRIGQQKKQVGFIGKPMSRYLIKPGSMLSVSKSYYHTRLMSFLSKKYFNESQCGQRTVILVAGMHRSGTSALAGLIGRMGADLGPDLIGAEASNPKGHFEPRKIVRVNEDLIKRLEARSPTNDLPNDWLEYEETKIAKSKIQEIILADFSNQDLFVIKDPRLCLLLPLYHNLFEELGITIKIIVIRRAAQEVLKSFMKREGSSPEATKKYYEKHICALEANLAGLDYVSVAFDHLIETPEKVIEQISAFIPQLPYAQNRGSHQEITSFIEPELRHHNLK